MNKSIGICEEFNVPEERARELHKVAVDIMIDAVDTEREALNHAKASKRCYMYCDSEELSIDERHVLQHHVSSLIMLAKVACRPMKTIFASNNFLSELITKAENKQTRQ